MALAIKQYVRKLISNSYLIAPKESAYLPAFVSKSSLAISINPTSTSKNVQKLILSASLFCFALFCHFVAFTHIQMDVGSRPVRALQCRLQQNQTNTCTSRVYTHRLPSSYKDLFVIEISSLYSHMAHSLQNSTTQRVMSYLWQTERC